ncbi:M56 family metallopeptidase [uncultured Holdemania sp.]|uniref:M56 family metallopeptidase n=1 Tax=uncultured Holdemania sp. TaxID=527664 RepID=UPI002805479C|nr:M56 family metallopeptidase [uncultured Holdemania sp.]
MLNKLAIFYLFIALNVVTSLAFLLVYLLRNILIKLSAITYSKLLKTLALTFILPIFLILPIFSQKYFTGEVVYTNTMADFDYYVILPAHYLNDRINKETLTFLICLGLIWLMIVLIKSLFFISCLHKTKQAVIKTNVTDDNLCSLLKANMRDLKINRSVDIFRNTEIQRPCMVQLRKPTILIPYFKLSEKDLNYLIQHELLHIKTHDTFYIRLARVYKIFYWYNPLIILFMNSLIFSCEIANDERLTENLSKPEKIYFIRLLRNCIKQAIHAKDLEVISFSDNTKHTIMRIEHIMNFKKKKWNKYLVAFMSSCILVSTPITAYAMTDTLYLGLSKLPSNQKIENIEQDDNGNEFEKFIIENVPNNDSSISTKVLKVNPRGLNSIDEIINRSEKITLDKYSASSNTEVEITLTSDSKISFTFQACPVNGGTCKQVKSNSDYKINTTISSFKNETYTFYIINNSSRSENHVYGHIYIR